MSDLEFAQNCCHGDQQAWSEFVLRYSSLIYNYIYSVLKVKGCSIPAEQVEDIFQDIFKLLIDNNYKKLASYRGKNGCSLASWLRRVTINFTIDYLRALKTMVSLDAEDQDGLTLAETLKSSSVEGREFLNNQEKRKTLQECINLLESAEQYFLELFLNQKLTLDQIRESLKLNRGAVDMRKARIFGKLEECFKKKGFLS